MRAMEDRPRKDTKSIVPSFSRDDTKLLTQPALQLNLHLGPVADAIYSSGHLCIHSAALRLLRKLGAG